MFILAIDTSCDETSVAIVENDRILANTLSSQIQSHKEWGGVVPSLAKRKHEELIDLVIERALKQAKIKLELIDFFAVTKGPGLAVALEVGIKKAKELAIKYQKPLIPVNHMEGHLYSVFAKNSKGFPYDKRNSSTHQPNNLSTEIDYQFPLLVLLISGGHTEFILMRDHGNYEILGKTLDDAIGESYDKVGRMLDMGYPAGPVLEKIAENGDENKYILPIPMQNSGTADMSYSGLKTAAMKLVNDELGSMNKYGQKFQEALQGRKPQAVIPAQAGIQGRQKINSNFHGNDNIAVHQQLIADISASFQKAAVDQILIKTRLALKQLDNPSTEQPINDFIIAGGVSQNKYLRKKFRKEFGSKLRIHYPNNKRLYTDNAGMIAIAGYYNAIRKQFLTKISDIEKLDREPNWAIDEINN